MGLQTYIQVSYLFRNVRTRPFKPSIYRVNIWGHLNPTPLNRVNNAISNTSRLTYKCHTFLEASGQGLPHLGLIKGGNFNSILIDRVNKSFSNNIVQTYKCYILLETSGQGLPI